MQIRLHLCTSTIPSDFPGKKEPENADSDGMENAESEQLMDAELEEMANAAFEETETEKAES